MWGMGRGVKEMPDVTRGKGKVGVLGSKGKAG